MRSSPERRRLRFSFHINNVKDPSRLSDPIPLTPDVGGGGYLSNLEFRVKSFFAKPSNQTHQNQPRPIPVDRGDLLVKSANQVKKEFQRIPPMTCEDQDQTLTNSFQIPSSSTRYRRYHLSTTLIFTEYQIKIKVEYFTEPWNSYRTLRFSEERRFY